MDKYDILVGGKWEKPESGEYGRAIDPSNGSVVAEFAVAGKEDTGRAVEAGRRAFEHGEWSRFSYRKRAGVLARAAEIMEEISEELNELESRNGGKPIRQASFFDIPLAISCIQYYASLGESADREGSQFGRRKIEQPDYPGTYGIIDHEPYGLVGAIVPWNVPLLMAAWKTAPALLAGNSVLLKPSHITPLTALKLGEIFYRAGLPEGTLSVLPGEGKVVGSELASNRDIDALSFTGSTETGKEVMRLCSGNAKKVMLELGGKSPNIVFEDANLDRAVRAAMFAVFLHSGQLCESGTRLLLSKKIYDKFLERMEKRAASMRMGPTDDMGTDIGPLISKKQLDKVKSYIDLGVSEGARLIHAGKNDITEWDPASGYYVKPTIFADVTRDMKISREEIFGPVLAVMKFSDEEEAASLANDTIYGLASAIWTSDMGRAFRVGRQIRAGTVWINDYHLLTTYAPRGGYKQSGFGRELGEEGFAEYLQTKHYFINEDGQMEDGAYDVVNATGNDPEA